MVFPVGALCFFRWWRWPYRAKIWT